VTLIADTIQPNRDDYGRLLAYIIHDGVNVNRQLIVEGYAHEMSVGSGYDKSPDFTSAEAKSRAGGRGLWSACRQKL
jgi:micrococcal nuclease